jgi:hypothetical protein
MLERSWWTVAYTQMADEYFPLLCREQTLREAVDKAYQGVEAIRFNGMFYRRDIGAR